MTTQETNSDKARPPIRTLRSGLLFAKFWERQTEEHGAFYSVSFELRYKSRNGHSDAGGGLVRLDAANAASYTAIDVVGAGY